MSVSPGAIMRTWQFGAKVSPSLADCRGCGNRIRHIVGVRDLCGVCRAKETFPTAAHWDR